MKIPTQIWLVAGLLIIHAAAAMGEECYPEVVWIVRHAEKVVMEGERDPPLTAKGQARAEALADLLGPEQPVAIYSTDYRRTRDTVVTLAKHSGVKVTIVDARDTDGLVNKLLGGHCGQRVVVVGHSNTVPTVIKQLGIDEKIVLDEKSGYGDLFEVRWDNGEAGLERRRFGE